VKVNFDIGLYVLSLTAQVQVQVQDVTAVSLACKHETEHFDKTTTHENDSNNND